MYNQVSDFVKDVLARKKANQLSSKSLLWGALNVIVLALAFYDLHMGGVSLQYAVMWWLASVVCFVCSLNIIIHTTNFFGPIMNLNSIEINDRQKRLLSVKDSDRGFRSPGGQISSTPVPGKSTRFSELFEATIRTSPPSPSVGGMSPSNRSWFGSPSSFIGSYGGSPCTSPLTQSFSPGHNLSMGSLHSSTGMDSVASNSWIFQGNRSMADSSFHMHSADVSDSHMKPFNQTSSPPMMPSLNLSTSSPISTKEELDDYLKQFCDSERKRQILYQSENQNGNSSPLWSYSTSPHSNMDFAYSLGKNVYQLASKDADCLFSSSPSLNETSLNTNKDSISVSKIWNKRNVTQRQLFQFEENLRIWLSMNILEPLVHQIEICNESLSSVAPELKIGNVGVDKLKKAVANISGVKHLNNLLPFLEVSMHQDYLVQRLKDLSKGGAVSEFRWNGGGSFKGKPWRDEYPTDSYLLLHLFALYMDLHLPPDPTKPDGRVFSNVHVVKTPEKPPKASQNPVLYLSQVTPPHLQVCLPMDEECDVGKGVKNCLHSLILFCHYLVNERHSHIGGLNLNLAGINIAWVVRTDQCVN